MMVRTSLRNVAVLAVGGLVFLHFSGLRIGEDMPSSAFVIVDDERRVYLSPRVWKTL
jgi:hypothetical protein